jgi:hypothetical protein
MLRILIGAALAAVLVPVEGVSQVVREDDQKSIAGVIGGIHPPEVFWTFKSAGGEILFASLDAEIYAVGEQEHETLEATVQDEESGGCEDEGGPARFCLQVLDAASNVMCEATRPAPPPGWQRDARLACVLPTTTAPAAYSVRVSAAFEGACTMPSTAAPTATERPFLLNFSLRGIAPSGVSIQQATAQSKNR